MSIEGSAAFREGGLVGFFGSESAGEAAPDYVGSGASLGVGEGVDSFQCFGADAEALHLSGGHERSLTHPTVLRNVSQWDTMMS